MTGWRPCLMVQPRLGSQPGTAVAMLGRQFGQGGQDIQNGQGPGHLLETGDLLSQAFPQVQEEFRLPFDPDLFRPQDPGFVILEVRGDEALGVHQGLLADVVGGHQVQVGLGDLQVIAEDLVVAHFQAVDAGAAALLGFQAGDPVLAFPAEADEFVQLRVIAFPDDPAIFDA